MDAKCLGDRSMTAIDAVHEINALGLRVRISGNKILVSPKELIQPYADELTAIIEPIREELVQHLQDVDQAFLKEVESQARARGYRMVQHRKGERPRVLVP